jgi:hypothetical protein
MATIMDATVVKATLQAQGLEPEPPVIRPPRGPPQPDMVEVWWC